MDIFAKQSQKVIYFHQDLENKAKLVARGWEASQLAIDRRRGCLTLRRLDAVARTKASTFALRQLCRRKITGEFRFEALRCSTDLSSRPGRAPETHSDALAVDLLAGHGIVAEVWLECGLSTKSGATAVAT